MSADLIALARKCGATYYARGKDGLPAVSMAQETLVAFAAALSRPKEAAPSEEREAMAMLWDDQPLEEKAHYIGVVRKIAAIAATQAPEEKQ